MKGLCVCGVSVVQGVSYGVAVYAVCTGEALWRVEGTTWHRVPERGQAQGQRMQEGVKTTASHRS